MHGSEPSARSLTQAQAAESFLPRRAGGAASKWRWAHLRASGLIMGVLVVLPAAAAASDDTPAARRFLFEARGDDDQAQLYHTLADLEEVVATYDEPEGVAAVHFDTRWRCAVIAEGVVTERDGEGLEQFHPEVVTIRVWTSLDRPEFLSARLPGGQWRMPDQLSLVATFVRGKPAEYAAWLRVPSCGLEEEIRPEQLRSPGQAREWYATVCARMGRAQDEHGLGQAALRLLADLPASLAAALADRGDASGEGSFAVTSYCGVDWVYQAILGYCDVRLVVSTNGRDAEGQRAPHAYASPLDRGPGRLTFLVDLGVSRRLLEMFRAVHGTLPEVGPGGLAIQG